GPIRLATWLAAATSATVPSTHSPSPISPKTRAKVGSASRMREGAISRAGRQVLGMLACSVGSVMASLDDMLHESSNQSENMTTRGRIAYSRPRRSTSLSRSSESTFSGAALAAVGRDQLARRSGQFSRLAQQSAASIRAFLTEHDTHKVIFQ